MPGRIDVRNSRELQATLLALRAAPKEVQGNVRRYTRELLLPEFRKGMAERATAGRVQQRMLVDTARIAVSNQNVRMSSATGRRKLRGGLVPSVSGSAFEFGARPGGRRRTYDRRSPKGKVHSVTRNTTAQLPAFRAKGWTFYPTVADLMPRFAALWVQTSIRTVLDAFDKRG